jgi:CHAT domain-containing protein
VRIDKIILLGLIICCTSQLRAQLNADKLYKKGKRLYAEGHYDSSTVILESARLLYFNHANLSGSIKTDYAIGENRANAGDCKRAIKVISEALKKSEDQLGSSHRLTAEGYYYLSRAYGGCGRAYDKAIQLVHKSISLKSKIYGPESSEIAFDYTFIGYYFDSKGEYDSAMYYLERALLIRKKDSGTDPVELSHTLYFLAKTYENKSDLKNSLKYNLEALDLRKEALHANHPTLSNSLNSIGNVYKNYGNFDLALSYYLQALEIRKKTLGDNHPNVAGSYYTIGNLYGNLFNYHRAIQFIEQGNRIYMDKYGENTGILHTYLAYLGSLYAKLNKHQQAEEYLHKAKNLCDSYLLKDHPYRAIVYNMLGDYYADRKNDSLQIKYFHEAQRIYKISYGNNSLREADILVKLGIMHTRLLNNDKAVGYFSQALGIFKSGLGNKSSKLGNLYVNLGDISLQQDAKQDALNYYHLAIDAIAIDDVYNNEHLPSIRSVINKPLVLDASKKMARAYYLLFVESKDLALLRKSMITYRYAIDLVDEIISGYYLDLSKSQLQIESRDVYEQAINVAYLLHELTRDDQYKHEAFKISEKSKSMLLLTKTRDEEAKRIAAVPDRLINKERDLQIEINHQKKMLRDAKLAKNKALLAEYRKSLFESQREYETFKLMLQDSFPDYFNFNYNKNISSVSKIRKELADKTAIIEYFETDSTIYSFIITSNLFELIKIHPESNFESLIRNYNRSLTDQSLIIDSPATADSLYSSTAFQLYRLLLSPVMLVAPTINKLIIIPDDKLSQINFGTFLTEYTSPTKIHYPSLSYLMRKYDISYAYSTTWKSSLQVSNSNISFCGFAPSYTADAYISTDSLVHPLTFQLVRDGNLPLPGAISEVFDISELMSGDRFTHKDASETNFKTDASNYSIIHLAMHSLLNNDEPEYSELLFNNEKDSLNDGYLYINEIYNLDLKAELVVLSACSSGYGKVQIGEGPISLSRAFSYAGCPSVVMSMWKIPDEATRSIMIEFYKNLKEGKNKDSALREAQLKYLDETEDPLLQHPFYWASFLAMGDTKPITVKSTDWSYGMFYLCIIILAIILAFRNRL